MQLNEQTLFSKFKKVLEWCSNMNKLLKNAENADTHHSTRLMKVSLIRR